MGLQYYKNEIGKFQVQTCHFTRIKSYHFEKRVVVLQEESWKKEKFFFTLYEDFILVSLLKSILTALAHVWFGCNHCCAHNRQQTGQWDAAVDGGSGVTCGLIATDCSCVSWLRAPPAPPHLLSRCRWYSKQSTTPQWSMSRLFYLKEELSFHFPVFSLSSCRVSNAAGPQLRLPPPGLRGGDHQGGTHPQITCESFCSRYHPLRQWLNFTQDSVLCHTR